MFPNVYERFPVKKRRGHEWNSETEFSHRMEVHYSQNSFRFQEVSLKREIESKVILLFDRVLSIVRGEEGHS